MTDDTIYRQAAIDAMLKLQAEDEELYGCRIPEGFDGDRAKEALEQLPSAQPEPQWIPCSEKLPKEEKKTYWVCTDTEYQCECRWTNNRFGFGEGEWGWSIFDTPQYSKPIAWMPLPEPYKEKP